MAGLGMMDCKQAKETDGDIGKAVDTRKKEWPLLKKEQAVKH